MDIGLIGYGKMGRLIGKIAGERGHAIAEIIDPYAVEATGRAWGKNTEADVFIDFSTPASVIENVKTACDSGRALVIGTTGWIKELETARQLVENAGIGCIWSSNFSPAVQMFFRLVRSGTKLANGLPECDVALSEIHHRHKLDSPSGTALTAAEICIDEIDRKTAIVCDRPAGKIAPYELHLASLRMGEVPGTHSVYFDFPAETLEIKSISRSREGFALGAVMAAEWIFGKQGFYRLEDVFDEVIGGGDTITNDK